MSARYTHRTFWDRDNIPIDLLVRTWERHILHFHPELERHESAIGRTIKEPHHSYPDAQFPNRRVYYRSGSMAGFEEGVYVKVVVEYRRNPWGEREGVVITAYTTTAISEEED